MGRLTVERLKSWLNGNQPARERMCAELLGMLPQYNDIRPRRPDGGPDGGRDIDATYSGRPARVGIGFRNNVSDDDEDKKWAIEKGKSDAASAKRDGTVDHFVFFTNVDLTPAECDSISRHTIALGFSTCEIFNRERMRVLLDSPEGFATRSQYLGIKLKSAEQAAFFARFAETLRNGSSANVVERMDRLEFLVERTDPVFQISLFIGFNTAKWAARVAGSPFTLRWVAFNGCSWSLDMLFVVRKESNRGTNRGSMRALFARSKWREIDGTAREIQRVGNHYHFLSPVRRSNAVLHLSNQGDCLAIHGRPVQMLNRSWIFINAPETIASNVDAISLDVNGWQLAQLKFSLNERILDNSLSQRPVEEWPFPPHNRERSAHLTHQIACQLDFGKLRPKRANHDASNQE
jgi:hypothetical protein